MKQYLMEAAIVLGVVGAVAFIVTFNPWKHEQLPPIPMIELKAEPPKCESGQSSTETCVTTTATAIAAGQLRISGPTCWTEDKDGGTTFHDCGYSETYERQIRALTKRIEELEKRTDPNAGDHIYCSNATIEECYKQYGIEELEKHLGPWTEMLPENVAPTAKDTDYIILNNTPLGPSKVIH